MSKAQKGTRRADRDGLRGEYRFDYSSARPNRFASRVTRDAVAVVLEPDVASVFGSSRQVNALLRSVIAALPDRRPVPARHRRKTG